LVSGNNLTSSSYGPTYTPSALGAFPSWTFPNGGATNLIFTTPISASTVAQTWYFVMNTAQMGNSYFLGNSTSPGAFTLGFYGNVLYFQLGYESTIGDWTSPPATGVWYVLAVSYNQSTGAYVIAQCASGTCTTEVSGTNAVAFTAATTYLGANFNGEAYGGQFVEVGYRTTADLSGIASYVQCQYGI
jgi:hypothetical protein